MALQYVQTDMGRVLMTKLERQNHADRLKRQERVNARAEARAEAKTALVQSLPPERQVQPVPQPVPETTLYGAPARPLNIRSIMVQVDLPEKGLRWTVARKGAIASAVLRGQLTLSSACERYGITAEELTGWMCDFRRGGEPALRATEVAKKREPAHRPRARAQCQEL